MIKNNECTFLFQRKRVIKNIFRAFLFITFCSLLLISQFSYAKSHIATPNFTNLQKTWIENHPEINIAYDAYFPPYSFINDNNELEGFSIDVFKIISEQTGIQFKMSPKRTWKSIYQAAKNKEVDMVASMVNRKERLEWFNFSKPYISKSLVVITQGENESIQNHKHLAGKAVALVKDYQYVKGILEKYPTITPYFVDTILDGLNAVSTGKADATITYLGAGHYYRTKYLLSNLKYSAVYDKNNSPESISIRKDWPELVGIINQALSSIPERKLQELRARWLPEDYQDLLIDINLTDKELAWIDAHPTILLGVDPEFAPFEYMEKGKYSGMTSDYIKLLNERLNIKMEVVEDLSWGTVIKNAENQKIDVLPAVGKTTQRQQYLKYTAPYLNFHRVIITRTDTPFIVGLEDLKDSRVAVQVNTSHHGYLKEHADSDITPITYATLAKSLMAVSGGEADAFIGNVASSTYWIRKLNLTNLKVTAPVSQEVQSLHFAIRKDWPELVTILQKGLDSISAVKRKKISEKWIYLDTSTPYNTTLIWQIVIAFSLALFVFLLWNLLLNRKVKEKASELLRHAHYDPLTSLPNRFLIQEKLTDLIKEGEIQVEKLALISIDLDDFKKINDSFGHHEGDTLLKEVATRLNKTMSGAHILGRLNSDQFIVIIPQLQETTEIGVIAKQLTQCFNDVFILNGSQITLTASLGIAIFPEDGNTAELLIKNSGSATHYSKLQGPGSIAFYTEQLQQDVSRKLLLEEQMRGALDRNEFHVVYQPKINSQTLQATSFEALLRWKNEKLGDISPVEFIPIAENNGLIVAIGLFVLQTALTALSTLNTDATHPYSMAVNLSPRQFRSNTLFDDVKKAIQASGVNRHCLELEITEGVLMSGYSNVDTTLKQFHDYGLTLAMDDFGQGYSSMSYLRKYTFNILKIDREFISELSHNESDRMLVSAIIAMSHNLGMKVVAEGVESQEQCEILKQYNCDILQGWLFSKALPLSELIEFLDKKEIA